MWDYILTWSSMNWGWIIIACWACIGVGISSFHMDVINKGSKEWEEGHVYVWIGGIVFWPGILVYWFAHAIHKHSCVNCESCDHTPQ
jgi:hypothetical protein